jgi:hypothetical protein
MLYMINFAIGPKLMFDLLMRPATRQIWYGSLRWGWLPVYSKPRSRTELEQMLGDLQAGITVVTYD